MTAVFSYSVQYDGGVGVKLTDSFGLTVVRISRVEMRYIVSLSHRANHIVAK
jgi:hypothetical protein